MPTIAVKGASKISYEILKDYHFTAEAIYDRRIETSQEIEEEHIYTILMEVESEEEAKQVFLTYLHRLNELEIPNHAGHLAFITQSIIKFEGDYINNDAVLNDLVLDDLNLLDRLLTIKDQNIHHLINIKVSHKSDSDTNFPLYSTISNSTVIAKTIDSAIKHQFDYIKGKCDSYSYDIANTLSNIEEPTVSNINELVKKAGAVSTKAFKVQLLYTVCNTLLKYLNEWSPLNPNKVLMTNDQARVLYYTCKIHGLLPVSHVVELDALNYIRMVLRNNKDSEPMNGVISATLPINS